MLNLYFFVFFGIFWHLSVSFGTFRYLSVPPLGSSVGTFQNWGYRKIPKYQKVPNGPLGVLPRPV